MTTELQQATFETLSKNNGRTIESRHILDDTRDAEGRYIELEIVTSHQAGRGYRVSMNRAIADGRFRRVRLGFGDDSDVRSMPTAPPLPTSSRFNQATHEKFHKTVLAQFKKELPEHPMPTRASLAYDTQTIVGEPP